MRSSISLFHSRPTTQLPSAAGVTWVVIHLIYFDLLCCVSHSLVNGFSQQAAAQLIGEPKYLRF